MPVFEYRATDSQGSPQSGRLVARDLDDAARALASRGWRVEHVREASPGAERPPEPRQSPPPGSPSPPPVGPRPTVATALLGPIFGKVGLPHLMFLFRQLSSMLGAGVGMVQSLETLSRQTRQPKLRRILLELRDHAQAGRPLSAGLQRYPEVFSPLMLSLIRAGEEGGMLERTLSDLAGYVESEIALRRMIRRETMYPKVVVAMSVLIVGGANLILSSVAPQGSPFRLHNPLNEPGTWMVLGPALLALFLFLRVGLQNPAIRRGWDLALSVVPGLAGTVRGFATAKFGRAFGALYRGGVPMHRAMLLAADACGNEYIRSRIYPGARMLQEGGTVSQALSEAGVFSPIVLDMIRTGETTGNLDQMLLKLSEYYEDEAATLAKRNAVILGAFAYLAVAAFVGYLVFSFYSGYASYLQRI
ncbi:MAG: type II secretion system F family protein [Fimbriimonadales bacterium]|nr:type II secretion system F family protein [Fimbriimonadales bacterium]